jgi:hypothetical protein
LRILTFSHSEQFAEDVAEATGWEDDVEVHASVFPSGAEAEDVAAIFVDARGADEPADIGRGSRRPPVIVVCDDEPRLRGVAQIAGAGAYVRRGELEGVAPLLVAMAAGLS